MALVASFESAWALQSGIQPAPDEDKPRSQLAQDRLAAREAITASPTGKFPAARHSVSRSRLTTGPTWQDALRCLELDDAARRSIAKRRSSTLEFQVVTEEAGFKGTMTLVGCGIVWVSLVLLILSVWVPWTGWLILPVFTFFLVLQLLRWVVPAQAAGDHKPASPSAAPAAVEGLRKS